jgi:hypothetical protein
MDNLAWLQPVLIGAAIVFLLDLIGNMISFSNRFLNALTTAGVFAVVFGALIHLGIVKLDVRTVAPEAPAATAPATP